MHPFNQSYVSRLNLHSFFTSVPHSIYLHITSVQLHSRKNKSIVTDKQGRQLPTGKFMLVLMQNNLIVLLVNF